MATVLGLEERIETDLRRALLRQEFQIYYQPILGLERAEIVGFEALMRWLHPQRGMVSPGEFIPLAEESGSILAIGEWVLEGACRQMKRWQANYPCRSRLFVSVNLSPRQVLQPGLSRRVAEVLRQTGLPPDSLQLEITEGVALGEEATVIESLAALRGLGVRLAMDDFGTGYSSFSYLQRFPFEVLKIAQPFVKGLGQDAVSTAIVRAIVTLAKALNLAVTAEGVESHWQLERLRELGCDGVQGYYLGRPLPVEETTALLSQWFHPTEAPTFFDRSPVL